MTLNNNDIQTIEERLQNFWDTFEGQKLKKAIEELETKLENSHKDSFEDLKKIIGDELKTAIANLENKIKESNSNEETLKKLNEKVEEQKKEIEKLKSKIVGEEVLKQEVKKTNYDD